MRIVADAAPAATAAAGGGGSLGGGGLGGGLGLSCLRHVVVDLIHVNESILDFSSSFCTKLI